MPIYEFRCRTCGKQFEQVVFGSNKEPVQCPGCGSVDAERLMSAFASCGLGKQPGSSCAPSSGHS
jgi:putative FmdB family regulatory protein